MSASQTRRSAGVLSRLAARLVEKNRAQAVVGRSFVPAHVSVSRPQSGRRPLLSALILQHPPCVADGRDEAPRLHSGDNSPTTSKDNSNRLATPGRPSRPSRQPSSALPLRALPRGGKLAVLVWTSCLPRHCFSCFCVSFLGCTPHPLAETRQLDDRFH